MAEVAFIKSVFADAGIPIALFDEHTSSVLAGMIGDIPCRIMLLDDDLYDDALDLLEDAGLFDEYEYIDEEDEETDSTN